MMELGQVARSGSPLLAPAPPADRSRDDLWEAIEAREVVERSLARLAATRRSESDLRRLDRALEVMREAGDDRDAFAAGDLAFHVVLSEAACNGLLAGSMDALRGPVREMIALYADAAFRDGRTDALVDEHARLADAVGRGDADDAAAIICAMMGRLRDVAATATPSHTHPDLRAVERPAR